MREEEEGREGRGTEVGVGVIAGVGAGDDGL